MTDLVHVSGEVLGQHDGYPFCAIGQRKLGVFGNGTTYVVGIKEKENIVVVGTKEDLKKQEMFVRQINYVKYPNIEDGNTIIGQK